MSQTQELERIYKELKELNDGLDISDLAYGINGYYYNVYPKEWNKTFSRLFDIEAPVTIYNENNYSNFDGDIVYSVGLWDNFKQWVLEERNIKIKDFYDVKLEELNLPNEITVSYEKLELPDIITEVNEKTAGLINDKIMRYLRYMYEYEADYSYELQPEVDLVIIKILQWNL